MYCFFFFLSTVSIRPLLFEKNSIEVSCQIDWATFVIMLYLYQVQYHDIFSDFFYHINVYLISKLDAEIFGANTLQANIQQKLLILKAGNVKKLVISIRFINPWKTLCYIWLNNSWPCRKVSISKNWPSWHHFQLTYLLITLIM